MGVTTQELLSQDGSEHGFRQHAPVQWSLLPSANSPPSTVINRSLTTKRSRGPAAFGLSMFASSFLEATRHTHWIIDVRLRTADVEPFGLARYRAGGVATSHSSG